jgi:hypothetical protein
MAANVSLFDFLAEFCGPTTGRNYIPCHYYGGHDNASERFWFCSSHVQPADDVPTDESWRPVASMVWGILLDGIIDFLDASEKAFEPEDPERASEFKTLGAAFRHFATSTFVDKMEDDSWSSHYATLKGAMACMSSSALIRSVRVK